MSGLWVAGYMFLAGLNNWPLPFTRFGFHPLFAIGGFIFGVGASINQGCSVSTMHQFARGNISMLFTMCGWFFGWCLWMATTMNSTSIGHYPQQSALDADVVKVLFFASVIFTLAMVVLLPKQRERWLGISLIGLLVGVLFYIEPKWAPSRLIQDAGAALFESTALPGIYRVALVMMLLIGMWVSVLILHDLKLRWPTPHKIVRHGSAGVLMGFGGAMALGGNDAQILMGLPNLSIGAITAVFFMLAGIATEQLLYHRGRLFYQKR